MVLELKKFDMNCINFERGAPVIFIIGRRDTGKSFLVRDILHHNKDVPMSTVVSGTESGDTFYANFVPKLCIQEQYNPDIIENVLRRQKAVLKQIKTETKDYSKSSSIDPRHVVILDNCFYDHLWVHNKMMKLMFMQGRCWKVMLVITMSYPLGIHPSIRTKIDYVFIFREPSYSNRKRIYENYAGVFPSFDSFNTIMDNTIENFECLVINNKIDSTKLEDKIFWYKAEQRPDFKLGGKELWEISNGVGNSVSDNEGVVVSTTIA